MHAHPVLDVYVEGQHSGLNLLSLKRVRIGEIKLSNLAEGSWRNLSRKELNFLAKIQ